MIGKLKSKLILNAKNLVGWKTDRKIVVFSVDDYGNVRLDSKEARENLDKAKYKALNRFDRLDTLETREDLEMLFDVLCSVKDRNGRHAVFTPFSLPCNINFEKMEVTGNREYHYELLPETFSKKTELQPKAYKGTWELWIEGVRSGVMVPQFHGREHLNLKVFEEKLTAGDDELLANLNNRSFTSLSDSGYSTISPLAAFDFWEFNENDRFHEVVSDGLEKFEEVYGFRATHFTPPVYNSHPVIYDTLKKHGIDFIDSALVKNEHQGKGNYRKKFNYTGKKSTAEQIFMVRNVVFEPTEERGINWVNFAERQIEAAFRWKRPAIISSHRVNFCGHIDPVNREKGLEALGKLLGRITQRWPDVEFMAANELGDLINMKVD